MKLFTMVTESEAASGAEDAILAKIATVVNENASAKVLAETVEEAREGYMAYAFYADGEPVTFKLTLERVSE